MKRQRLPSLSPHSPWRDAQPLLTGLTLWALLVHGYHPFVEDGGVYAAGIEKLLHPELFPDFTAFATEHLRFSLFAPLIAALVRATHLSLPWILFLCFSASLWAALAGAYRLISRVTPSIHGRIGAVAFLASALGVPVAGTSLILVDPYLTARSLSTPLALFALSFTFDFRSANDRSGRFRALLALTGCLSAAALLHPLMAAYGCAACLLLLCASLAIRKERHLAFLVLLALSLLVAALIQLTSQPDSSLQTAVAMTRYYWFPFRWHWYEQIGLFGPLLVLGFLAHRKAAPQSTNAAALARSGWMLGLLSTTVAVLFCRTHYAAHLVARLQPLRCFSTVYLLMLLLLGACLAEHWMRGHLWRWAVLFVPLGALMVSVERATFPATAHLELPGRPSGNAWVQAFLWIRDNTPNNAVFAMDPHYIEAPGEDAHCFRALAERSALPDYSKDGGEASITPSLTPAWIAGQLAQTGLNANTDVQRRAAVSRLGADWLILQTPVTTALSCPYRNQALQVCRLD